MPIYFIPGLGFDHRMFSKLDLSPYEVRFLDWIKPIKGESIQQYAARMSADIEPDAVIVGHSFGGIMSQEIAAQRAIRKVVLISSIKSREELPLHFRVIKPLGIQHTLSKQLTFATFPLWARQHDYVTKEEQALFKEMVRQHDSHDLRWALRALSGWQTPKLKPATTRAHIHGSKDLTFPIKRIQQPCHVIDGGGHFMTYRHPEKVDALLKKILKKN